MITNQDYLSFHWHLYSHHTVWNDYGYLTISQKRQLSKAANNIAPEDQLFILSLNLIRLVDQEGLSGRESSLWVYYFRIWLGIPAKQIDWTWFLAAATVDLERPQTRQSFQHSHKNTTTRQFTLSAQLDKRSGAVSPCWSFQIEKPIELSNCP